MGFLNDILGGLGNQPCPSTLEQLQQLKEQERRKQEQEQKRRKQEPAEWEMNSPYTPPPPQNTIDTIIAQEVKRIKNLRR